MGGGGEGEGEERGREENESLVEGRGVSDIGTNGPTYYTQHPSFSHIIFSNVLARRTVTYGDRNTLSLNVPTIEKVSHS
jgi:hypothetical protein